MRRLVLVLTTIAACILIFVFARRRRAEPEIPFARVVREEIVSTLTTNGKVQPIEWAEAHAEVGGAVDNVLVKKGQQVAKGAPLVQLDARAPQADLASAQARVAQAQADLQTLNQGGRTGDLAAIENSLTASRQELAVAERDYASLDRLRAKNAATADDVRAAKDRVDHARIQIQGLESRRSTLVNRPDVAAAEGREREAEAAVNAARVRIAMTLIRAPIDGTVYQFDLRAGGYLNPGDLVAGIGRLERVRVVVFVDEPDLGRVSIGKPVTITWDAMPGRQWKGAVDRLPTQITPLGARQVGEVSSVIENPSRDLLPGTNVNVEIRAQSVANATVAPTAAIRREAGKTGVFVLAGDHVEWRAVKLGVASAARSQVEGLQEGESVALPTDRVLKSGMTVRPTYP